jgi:hypothetical protein
LDFSSCNTGHPWHGCPVLEELKSNTGHPWRVSRIFLCQKLQVKKKLVKSKQVKPPSFNSNHRNVSKYQ